MSCIKDREGIYNIVGKKKKKVRRIQFFYISFFFASSTLAFIPFSHHPRSIIGRANRQTDERTCNFLAGSKVLDHRAWTVHTLPTYLPTYSPSTGVPYRFPVGRQAGEWYKRDVLSYRG